MELSNPSPHLGRHSGCSLLGFLTIILSSSFANYRTITMWTQQDHELLPKPSDTFLKDLPPAIKRYTYQGESQCLDIIESESAAFETSTEAGDLLLFVADTETIEAINREEDAYELHKYISAFDTNEHLFLVRMPSLPRSIASGMMDQILLEAANSMDMSRSLVPISMMEIRGGSRGKQADYAWKPLRSPPGMSKFPSVVLEVAYSESDYHLNSSVRFWLESHNGKAKICLTLRINRSVPEIRIEKWEIQNERIHRSQVIRITKRKDQTYISDFPLVIAFESLFLRPPSSPREKDLEISQQQLERLAETVWMDQFE